MQCNKRYDNDWNDESFMCVTGCCELGNCQSRTGDVMNLSRMADDIIVWLAGSMNKYAVVTQYKTTYLNYYGDCASTVICALIFPTMYHNVSQSADTRTQEYWWMGILKKRRWRRTKHNVMTVTCIGFHEKACGFRCLNIFVQWNLKRTSNCQQVTI